MTPLLLRVILHNMPEAEVNQLPIRLLVNYWEYRPTALSARLDELANQGIKSFVSFVPWQAVESDISHTLTRFLQLVAEKGMSVSLIVSPEVGVHYTHSGIPKDFASRQEHLAQYAGAGPFVVNMPPNSYSLPSLFSTEFQRRYFAFLNRIDGILSDLARVNDRVLKSVSLILTGSLWKYYRSPQGSCLQAFGSAAGDFNGQSRLTYRQSVEAQYSQREFADPTPKAANRWKAKNMDHVNNLWFFQQSEDLFRLKTSQVLKRKAAATKVYELELFTPEADPGFYYSNFLQAISGGNGDFPKLSSLIDEYSARGSMQPYIHWSAIGAFRSLSDPEKQFLIMKSLLLMGGLGGGVLIDEAEWFSLSEGFRVKAESLARSVAHQEVRLKNRALYLTPHLWSAAEEPWSEFFKMMSPTLRMITSPGFLNSDRDSSLLIVDSHMTFTKDLVSKLIAWAKSGRVVIIPETPLFTEMAKIELENFSKAHKPMQLSFGVNYNIHNLGEGHLIVYQPSPHAQWPTFINAICSLSEIRSYCTVSDSRISIIPMQKKGGGLGLFIMNSAQRAVTADLLFPMNVSIGDLAHSLATDTQTDAVQHSSRFAIDVPPYGILPLSISRSETQVAPGLSTQPHSHQELAHGTRV